MYPKTLQYLMGHSDIGVTMNTYTYLGLEDALEEVGRMLMENIGFPPLRLGSSITHSACSESQVKSGQALTFRGNKKSAAQMGNASL